jgi:hypothetical protein
MYFDSVLFNLNGTELKSYSSWHGIPVPSIERFGPSVLVEAGTQSSYLIVDEVQPSDSGN